MKRPILVTVVTQAMLDRQAAQARGMTPDHSPDPWDRDNPRWPWVQPRTDPCISVDCETLKGGSRYEA